MSETRRDALVADVQKALESAYDTGWECGTGDVMREVTAGKELASVIVQKVVAARDAEIREALEAEYERVKEENTGLMGDYDLETAGTLSGLSFAIGLTEEGAER